MLKDLTSQPLYTRDKKTSNVKLNKSVYAKLKKIIEGKNGAIASYLDNLAIEQFQQNVMKKTSEIKSEKPELFETISKMINILM